jgi:hypothetical protein
MRILSFAEYIVFDNAIYCPETIFPTDFFSFGIGSAIVGNACFINPYIRYAAYFCGYLRLKAKAVLLQINAFYNFGLEEFIAGFHIRDIDIGKQVRQKGKKSVPDCVKEE